MKKMSERATSERGNQTKEGKKEIKRRERGREIKRREREREQFFRRFWLLLLTMGSSNTGDGAFEGVMRKGGGKTESFFSSIHLNRNNNITICVSAFHLSFPFLTFHLSASPSNYWKECSLIIPKIYHHSIDQYVDYVIVFCRRRR